MSSGGASGGAGAGAANMLSGIFSGIVGMGQRRKAKKMLASLQRPEYVIPNEIMQNQRMAQQAANEGLPSQQYNQAMQNIQRQQNRALTAAGSRRGALMALPGLQQQANDQLLNLDVKDAQARMANQQKLYGVNTLLANYRDKAFDLNKMQPYQQNYNYAQSLLGMGNQNLYGGIDKVLGGGGQIFDSIGGRNGKPSKSSGQPIYSNGYGPDSDYGKIENPYD